MRPFFALATFLFMTFSVGVQAAPSCTTADGLDRPRIGLVLGGGGARGISHIGVIRVLEELKVPVDYVAGTSMGSIVGGLYATGMNSSELEATVQSVDWKEIFIDQTDRAERTFRRKRDDELSLYGPKFGVGKDSSLLPRGAVSGQKITLFFQQAVSQRTQDRHFDELPIPFRAVAADIIDGEPVIIEDDNLAFAMRASMSIPGLFTPVEYQDHILVDGGIAKNLPVDVVRAMGADIVIAIDVGSPLQPRDKLGDFLEITGQLSGILVQRNTIAQRALLHGRDVLISPKLGREISSSDFTEGERAIEIGLDAGQGARHQLAALGIEADAYARHRAGIRACVDGVPIIQFVKLDNRSRFSDPVIEEKLHVALGEPLNLHQLEQDMAQIYALGFIDHAQYKVVEEDGQQGVLVMVKQDSRGTRFVETGGSLVSSNSSNKLEVRLAYLETDYDDLGSEFRTAIQMGENYGLLAELYKPLDNKLEYIIFPSFEVGRRLVNVIDDNRNKIAEVEVRSLSASLALGRELGNSAAVFAGIRRVTGDYDTETGQPTKTNSFESADWFVNGTWDTLDNRYFPSSGEYFTSRYDFYRKKIGADDNFEQFAAKGAITRTFADKHNFIGGIFYETTINGTAPVQNLARGGGFLRMSGFEPNELTGQHFGAALLGYRYRIADIPLVPPYLGVTLEYGNAADNRDDIVDDGIWNGSIYGGVPSFLGPFYIGYGWREDDSGVFFIRIGSLF